MISRNYWKLQKGEEGQTGNREVIFDVDFEGNPKS